MLFGQSDQHFVRRLLLVVILASTSTNAQTTLPSATTSNGVNKNIASDGSGTAPYRTSPPFLLFVIESLLIGLYLLLYGKRGWRVCCGLGGSLVFVFVSWVAIVNTLQGEFGHLSKEKSDIIIWVITSICGILGGFTTSLGAMWRVGIVLIGSCGGLSLAISIILMGRDCLPAVARWVILGAFTLAGLVLGPLLQENVGMAAVTSLTGSFLVFLGVDLLVNQTNGMSLGLRYIFDHNSSHAAALQVYIPPVSTRVFLVLIWCFSVIATVLQVWFYRKSPFIRTYQYLSAFDDRYTSSRAPNGTPENEKENDKEAGHVAGVASDSHDTMASGMNRRYQQAIDAELGSHSREGSPSSLAFYRGFNPAELASPDTPPSRPNSILSTSVGDVLASRPPTFFDAPLNKATEPLPPVPLVVSPPSSEVTQSFAGTFEIPVQARSGEYDDDVRSSTDVGGLPFSTTPPNTTPPNVDSVETNPLRHSDSDSTASSRNSRRSWRKPVPAIEVDDDSTVDGSAIHREFGTGLMSGRDVSLAPTVSTPSTGDISTILPATFGQPITPNKPSPPSPASDGRPRSPEEVRTGSNLALAQSAEVELSEPHISWAAHVNNPASTTESSSAAQSFRTASDDEGDFATNDDDNDSLEESSRHTPELSRDDSLSDGTASLRSPTAFAPLSVIHAKQGIADVEDGQNLSL